MRPVNFLVAITIGVWTILVSGGITDAARIAINTGHFGTEVYVPCTRPKFLRRLPVSDGSRFEFSVQSPGFGLTRKHFSSGPIREVEAYHHGLSLAIVFRWRFPVVLRPDVSLGRVAFQFPDRVERSATLAVDRGLRYQVISRFTAAGPLSVHVLRVRIGDARVMLRTANASTLFSKDTVRHMARNYRALAGVNGSFFSPPTSAPVGLLLSDGQILSSSFKNRSVFGIRADGSCFISQARLFAAISEDTGRLYLAHAVNQPPLRNDIVIYSRHWGPRTRTVPDPSRREFGINRQGLLVAAATGNLVIPEGGFVMSAQGRPVVGLRRRLKMGQNLWVHARLNGIFEGARFAVGGGPTLVRGGVVKVTSAEERFGPEIASGRAARTAIGYLGGTDLAIVTADGRPRSRVARGNAIRNMNFDRSENRSVGMTLYELARFMREIGCRDAMNLDGGGSTTMVVGGEVVNRPSDGRERPVHNALLVFARNN